MFHKSAISCYRFDSLIGCRLIADTSFAVTRDTSSSLSVPGKFFGTCNERFASFRSGFSSK